MKNPRLKKLLPHIIALVVFLTVSVLFCKPIIEGNVLNQDDITKWKGIAQNSFDYKEKNGHFPLWNPNLFSGMPNYQIAMQGKSILPDMTKLLSLGLPKPINLFFLACICFYILCLAFRARPVIAMLGGLAYAFSTYNAVVINAGHDTQMFATAFMPLLLAGLILTYEKKYWLGLAVSTLAAYMQIGSNHLQITYYFFLIAAAVTLSYIVIWIRKKEWKHIMIAGIITGFAGLIGLAGSAMTLMTTAEYAKYTMRGGKSISIDNQKDTVTSTNTSGLDTAYAFEYSLGKAESFTLLMPNAFGGDSYKHLSENSNVVSKLTKAGVNETAAQQLATEQLPRYWGELPFTAGPAYLGVFICLLGLIGFVIVKTPLRWGLFFLLTLMYVSINYSAGYDNELLQNFAQQDKNGTIGRAVIQGMKSDRQAMFGGQLLRALLFAVLLIGLLYFHMKNKIKPMVVAICLLVAGTAELLITSKNYLPDESYVTPDDLQSKHFSPTQVEQQILGDKDPDFRVYNTTANPVFDARTSSFFKSVTGYHPARLRIYQDVLDKYLSGRNINQAVLNMLNVKYFIQSNPESGAEFLTPNPDAYGPCWLAKSIKTVDGPVQEFLALRSSNLKDTVVVDKIFKTNAITSDSTASVKLLRFDNDLIEYESNTSSPQFAVFSEVYYPKGWNAYLDGKRTAYCKANYILRGLPLPPGKHIVKFIFEPASVKKGRMIMFIASILIAVIFIGGLFMAWKESNRNEKSEMRN